MIIVFRCQIDRVIILRGLADIQSGGGKVVRSFADRKAAAACQLPHPSRLQLPLLHQLQQMVIAWEMLIACMENGNYMENVNWMGSGIFSRTPPFLPPFPFPYLVGMVAIRMRSNPFESV